MRDLYIKTEHGDMYYEKYLGEDNSLNIIFLHGWGQSHKTFDFLIEELKKTNIKCNIYNIDFLGFGLSDEPNKAIKIDDYSNHLKQLILEEKIKNVVLIAHSFGGRVAIKYASNNDVDRVVLVNSAGINHHNLKYYLKILCYKIKKVFVYAFNRNNYDSFVKQNGSRDYNNLSYVMRGTFKKVVNKDLKKEMKKIKSKTLIIGSVFDKEVALEDNRKMHELIKNSEFRVFYRSGHFSYLDEKDKFLKMIITFINSN